MLKTLLRWFMPHVLYLGGGGSQSTNEFKPPEYTQQGWKDYLSKATGIANNPDSVKPYGGQTVADLSPTTTSGLQMLNDFATQGSPERTAAGQVIQNQAQGAMNPYAAMTNSYAGTTNPYTGVANPYMGTDNPYAKEMIRNSNQLITDAYKSGTAANTDAQFSRGGAYGGSAYQDQVGRNQQQLVGALGANTNSILNNLYTQSAGLAESGLNRSSGLASQDLQRGADLTSQDLNRGAQGWQSGQQNALSAAQLGLGQQGADQSAILAMLQGGQIPQQYQQALLNAAQSYSQQQQQAPFTLSDFLRNALGAASGTGSTQTYTGPGQSPITAALGGGLLGYGAFGGG